MHEQSSSRKGYFTTTLFETLVFFGLVTLYRYLLAAYGPVVASESSDFDALRTALRSGTDAFAITLLREVVPAVIIAPLIEEFLCRGIPIFLVRKFVKKDDQVLQGISWGVGLLFALVFAMGHRLRGILDALPHVAFGLFAWNAAWKRGLRYSVLMHSLLNLTLILLRVSLVVWERH